MRTGIIRSVVMLLGLGIVAGCRPKTPPPTYQAPPARTSTTAENGRTGSFGRGRNGGTGAQTGTSDRNLATGNPSNAGTDPNNYLITRKQYALSYNDGAGRPNWVSWNLNQNDLGTVERGQFAPDSELPSNFQHVTPRDYTSSGYDRGHNCPSADRTRAKTDNDATFLMSNIMPQSPANNQGPWKVLEDQCRDWTQDGSEVYIVCGSSGETGRTIGRSNHITIPAFTWKVILILPSGHHAPQDAAPNDRVIAVKMPNTDDIRNDDWRTFRVTPAQLERETGYSFFTNFAPNVQQALENMRDTK